MARLAFTSVVAARTRAAKQISSTPELLAAWLALGGLADDLTAIARAGDEAEAFNHAQGAAQTSGSVATGEVLASFVALQREYLLLLAALRAIRGAIALGDPKDQRLVRLTGILENRAQVTLSDVPDVEPDAPKKRTAKKSGAQEAVRAEIERDCVDLLLFSGLTQALAERRWTAPRLTKLRDDARALSGKLGVRAATKGAAKAATGQEQAAVQRQSAAWAAAYSLLAELARREARVAVLLREGAR